MKQLQIEKKMICIQNMNIKCEALKDGFEETGWPHVINMSRSKSLKGQTQILKLTHKALSCPVDPYTTEGVLSQNNTVNMLFRGAGLV